VTPRRHSYKSDRIALLAVSEDEIYLTAKVTWSIDRAYLLLRGSARGRVWRLVAEREHECLSALVYHRGETLLGTSSGVYRIRAGGLEPYALGFDVALLIANGERLIVGGGTSGALFVVREGRVEQGLALDFNAKSTRPAKAAARDEARAAAEMVRTGFLPTAPELAPVPPPLAPQLRQALAALDSGDFATVRRVLANAPAGALHWRLLATAAEKVGALDEAVRACDAYLTLRPLDLAVHAQKVALLARLGATAKHEEARLKLIDVEEAGATLLFAQFWLKKRTNLANVQARLQEANVIVPDTLPIVWMLFQVRLAQARLTEASELLARLEANRCASDYLTHARAQLLQAKGDTAGALAQYRLLAPLYLAETPSASFNLGLLGAAGDDRALVVEMTRVLCFAPEHAAAREVRKAALKRCGETNVSSWG
jgi:tetratricopeptide (TPR) repeat protein